MELSERKLAILHAIIDDYIKTGMPIGSRTISKRSGLNLSSATIRNEMADLEEEGYLEQPHTSAGRKPSQKAYRLYVNMLMQVSQLGDDERRYIQKYFASRMSAVESVIDTTAKVLSDMTNLTSVVLAPQTSFTHIKRIQIVRLAADRAVALFVLSTGEVKNIQIPVPPDLDDSYLEMLSGMLSERVEHRTLSEAVAAIQSYLEGETQTHREVLTAFIDAVKQGEMMGSRGKVVLGGAQNIFNHPEYQNVDKAKGFLRLLDSRESLYDMLSKSMDMEFTIRIGSENEIDQLKDMSVVTATYSIGGKKLGSFGVIGPTRMDYAKVMSVLSCVGSSMDKILCTMLNESGDEDGNY